MAAIFLAFLIAFGGQGPIHSGRCRGQTHPAPASGWTCTRTGWHFTIVFNPEHPGTRGWTFETSGTR